MTTVKRAEFLERFDDGIDLHDPDLQQKLTDSGISAEQLSKADKNRDGLLKGHDELDAVFKQLDRLDNNRDPSSIELSGKSGALYFALLDGRVNPPGSRAEFDAALKRDPAEASRLLNGMSMDDLLKTLDGLPPDSRALMLAQAQTQGLNVDRIQYACHTVANGCQPPDAPGELEATGQVALAQHFLEMHRGAASATDPEAVRVVRAVVSASEGNADSVQTKDSGIVSYGKYQFTLKIGSLKKVVENYLQRCGDAQGNLPPDSDAAKLASFLGRMETAKEGLRHDAEFCAALISAGRDPRMVAAQDATFDQMYLAGAQKEARANGVESPLALAIYADTNVQGGLAEVCTSTKQAWGNRPPPSTPAEEKEYLTLFLNNRAQRLERLADTAEATNKVHADMLRASAHGRVEGQLMGLLNSEGLDLTGGADGVVKLGTRKIAGVGHGDGVASRHAGTRC